MPVYVRKLGRTGKSLARKNSIYFMSILCPPLRVGLVQGLPSERHAVGRGGR